MLVALRFQETRRHVFPVITDGSGTALILALETRDR